MSVAPHTSACVAIIGGGFSGTVTAIHLARLSGAQALRILLIDTAPTVGRGLAYRFEDDNLLLNVPAGNMSALADDPGHFLSYCQRIDPSLSPGSFVSRRLYGHYLQDTLAQAQAIYPDGIETLTGEVAGLERAPGTAGWEVTLATGQKFVANRVVLATGHQAPKFPIPLWPEATASVIDPWDFGAMQRLSSHRPVVILGTGHTAIDALFCLTQSHPTRPVLMLSRHGLLPHRHRPTPTPPQPHAFPEYLREAPASVRGYVRAFRQHLKTIGSQGGDWRDALNALRPHTPWLWQSLPPREQRRFLRHLQAQWDVHRHRLAPIAAQRLDTLLAGGLVQVIAGRICSVHQKSNEILLELRRCDAATTERVQAAAIVNCTGPSTDIKSNPSRLLGQMLQAGLIQADANGLGLLVSEDHHPLNAKQHPVEDLWYVGPLLKAQFWEATAVPELRVHTLHVARSLLASLNSTARETSV